MTSIPCAAAAILLAAFSYAAHGADLGTKPTITIIGVPETAHFGPSWVSAAIPEGSGFALTQTQMGYFFEVAGPDGFFPVPVLVDYVLSGSASIGGAAATSRIKIVTNGTSGPERSVGSLPGNLSYLVSDTMSLTLTTNAAYPLYLTANASTSTPGTSAFAYADPYIHIADDWLLSHPGYSVRVTPGIVNEVALPVPEPATWTMLVLGIGVLTCRRISVRYVK